MTNQTLVQSPPARLAPLAPERLAPEQLQSAFEEFTETSEQLGRFYASLEHRVSELTHELASSRQALERELHEKQRLAQRLAALLDVLPGGVIVLDAQGRVSQHNPTASELLGPVQIGEAWSVIVARAFAPRWDDGHDVSLVDGRRVNVATAALAGEPGQILLIKEVTETRILQDQLSHHRRLSATSELAATLAHQVRTPLATALLHIGNASRTGLGPEQRARAHTKALAAMRGLEQLVENMLTFARGRMIEASPILITCLLDELTAAVLAQPNAGGFEFRCLGDVGAGRVLGNQSALVSIMLNLISNSRAAMQEQGQLTLDAALGETDLVCTFTDNGPGVPAAAQARIFEPFFTTRQQGTGLGLAVALAVARAHGGDLTLDSNYAAGARFVLSLPLHSTNSPARDPSQ